MSILKYEKYKTTAVTWLSEVPSHWQLYQARRLFEQRKDAFLPGDEQLSATQKYGVIPQRLFMEQEDQKVVLALSGLENFKRVQPDDFVISLRSFQGGIERTKYAGCVSPAYTVLRPQKGLMADFWEYLLKSSSYIAALQTTTDGIREGKNISYAQFGALSVPLPPPTEQTTIAAFLDREVAKIDVLIAEQEKLIALLAEKRQATISHAVTKGLDRNASIKDSGVAWLGEVPAHWNVMPLKYLVELRSGGTPSKDNLGYWGGDVPWASAKDLKVEKLAGTIDRITQKAVEEGAASLICAGAVLVVVRGMILARMFPVVETLVPMAINQDLKAVLPRKGLNASFLAWLLRGSANESLQRLDEAGHGTKALRMDAWTSMQLPIPPLEEQIQLVEFISKETAKTDALQAAAVQAIELLNERRSALIDAAVTGQIDVQDAMSQTIAESLEAIAA
jgi:type I restriction enzyme S subunit